MDEYGLNVTENVIEFFRNHQTATVTFCQPRFVSKIKMLAEKYPDDYQIKKENLDGSIVAHIPVKDIHINHLVGREMNEEQRAACRERLAKYRRTTT